MIALDEIQAVVVTRGDVALEPALQPFEAMGMSTVVWDNSTAENDLSVYGRYGALAHVDAPIVIVQDDDVELLPDTITSLRNAYKPGKIVANMPKEYRERYTDSCLVGFGAIFDRYLPEVAFERFTDHVGRRCDWQWFMRTCDVVFTTLTPHVKVDFPFEYLPHTWDANRMYRQKGNTQERRRMLELCRGIRDGG